MSADLLDYDSRPDYCWRCNAVPAENSLGCCDRCVGDLRAGRVAAARRPVNHDDLRRMAEAAVPAFRSFAASMRRAVLAMQPAIKQATAALEAAGFRYVEGQGWLADADHDPRTFGPRPGSLRKRNRNWR